MNDRRPSSHLAPTLASNAERLAIDRVVAGLAFELTHRNSCLSSDGRLDPDFERQCRSILLEAFGRLRESGGESPSLVTVEYGSPDSLTRTAQLRASQDIHPAEPLMAAEALFGVALPIVVDVVLGRSGDVSIVTIARTLHHSVWRRFPPGAIAYVEILRAKLSGAHQESRRRVSLELHDRVAHGVAAGIQRIELSAMNPGGSAHDVDDQLAEAVTILRSTLADVQDIAFELRQRVGDRYIDDALAEYVDNFQDIAPPIELQNFGKHRLLPGSVGEEAFTIVLEAMRNARTHAGDASSILISTRWTPLLLTLQVSDDGPGFDPDHVRSRSLGLVGMKERAEAIGAHLEIIAGGKGTTVALAVPLDNGQAL